MVKKSITGFHQDEDGHWVAELSCGHTRHVRHDPPIANRTWVLREATRQNRIGILKPCIKCSKDGQPT